MNVGKPASNVRVSAVISSQNTDDSLVEPAPQCTYNARALDEDETRVAIGLGSISRRICLVLK